MAASEEMEERRESTQTAATPDASEATASASAHPEATPGVSPDSEPVSPASEPESRDAGTAPDSASKAANPFQRVGAKSAGDTDREAADEEPAADDTDRESADEEPAVDDTDREAADEEQSADAALENVISAAEVLEQSGQQRDWRIAPSQVDYEDPLLTCLSLVAGLLERPISREALKAGLPQAAEGFTPELAVRAAERAGLSAKVMRRPKLAQILPVSLPCILLLKAGNACVLLGFPDP